MATIQKDLPVAKDMYDYILPILVINDEWMEKIKENKNNEFFKIISEMRNSACQQIQNWNSLQPPFINMRLDYKRFLFDLFQSNEIQNVKKENFKIKDEDNNELFYNYFKGLIHFINDETDSSKRIIYKYVAPIMLWYEEVQENLEKEFKEKYLLYETISDIRHCVINIFPKNVMSDDILRQIMGNICIIYLAFGIDLYKNIENVRNVLEGIPTEYVFFNKNIKLEDGAQAIQTNIEAPILEGKTQSKHDVIKKIRNTICKKNEKYKEKYFIFSKLLHHFVSTKMQDYNEFADLFLDAENNLEWCHTKSQFIDNGESFTNKCWVDVGKFGKNTYNYIPLILVIEEKWMEKVQKNTNIESFRLITEMRNTASHHILTGNCMQALFVNMIKLYKCFEFDLFEFKKIRNQWNEMISSYRSKRWLEEKNFEIKNEEIILLSKELKSQDFFNYFKDLLQKIYGYHRTTKLFRKYNKSCQSKIKTICKYVAPIILWHQEISNDSNVDENLEIIIENELLLKTVSDIRNCVCNFEEDTLDENNLKQIIANICIIYLAFGVDLYNNDKCKRIKQYLRSEPKHYMFVSEKKNGNQTQSIQEKKRSIGIQSICIKEIILEIRDIISDKDHQLNEKYFLFGRYLHYFVSVKLKDCKEITEVFLNDNNNLQWFHRQKRFIVNNASSKKNVLTYFFEVITNYIYPVLIIEDKWVEHIKRNKQVEIFKLILKMPNIEIPNTLTNMVNIYKVFDFDLFQIKLIKNLCDKYNKTYGNNIINDEEIKKLKEEIINEKEFYNYFNGLLHFHLHSNIKSKTHEPHKELDNSQIKTIYRYAAPIILWYQNICYDSVHEHFKKEIKNNFLFKTISDIRHCVCHFSKLVTTNDILRKIMENICVIYLAFGVDLFQHRIKVEEILETEPSMFTFIEKQDVKKENEESRLDNEENNVTKDAVIKQIRSIIIDKYNPWKEKYFLFGALLHHFVSTKISNGISLTNVFLDAKNIVKWNKTKFTIDENNIYNPNERFIFEQAGPLFVWIEAVKISEETIIFGIYKQFSSCINDVRDQINRWLTSKGNTGKDEIILGKMVDIYKQINEYFSKIDTTKMNDPKTRCYNLFNELVKSYENSKEQPRSSFIFKISNNNETEDLKKFDHFNFSGLFYICYNYFENKSEVHNDDFYKKVKEITVELTIYMQNKIVPKNKKKINNLKIIENMQLIFAKFRQLNPSEYKNVHKTFSRICFYIVPSIFQLDSINFE